MATLTAEEIADLIGRARYRSRFAATDTLSGAIQSAPARGGGTNATPIVLKLGLHAGPCIAVTTGDVLDYFGAIVNIAARLEHECRGGEVIVSEAVAKDAEPEAALADRERLEETAMLRGVSAPVRYVRVTVGNATDRIRRAP
ncbi:MAG TPA: adenylate/guanylate cyclase domain-containing protein [Roseiarcus sp.]|nr:adenylate/guanylate cyclase domain-containing protein [Roseiarcus sp.]